MPFRFNSFYKRKPIRRSLLKIKKSQTSITFLNKCKAKKAEKVSLGTSVSASLTVESAFVLPIFLISMLVLVSYLDMLRVQVKITASLCESAKEMGIYMYDRQDSDNITTAIITREIGCAYAKTQIEKDLSGERLTGLKNGIQGISMNGSHIDTQKIKLQAKYRYQFPVSVLPVVEIPLLSACTVYSWNGFDANDLAGIDGQAGENMVYLTDWESVYHKNAQCSHLKLSVMVTDTYSVQTMKNIYGSMYTPCEKCAEGQLSDGTCYITEQGNCYHTSRSCSGLTRNVRYVPLEKNSNLQPCSRCG